MARSMPRAAGTGLQVGTAWSVSLGPHRVTPTVTSHQELVCHVMPLTRHARLHIGFPQQTANERHVDKDRQTNAR